MFLAFQRLMKNPLSCVWADFVNTAVVTGRTNNKRITGFVEGMDSLGESIQFGLDNPTEWLESLGFAFVDTISSNDYLEENDAVLSVYSFSIARF